MSTSRLLKAAAGGVLLTFCFALLSAAPMHTAPVSNGKDSSLVSSAYAKQLQPDPLPRFVPNPPKPPSVEEQFFFKSANRERAEQGLPQLKWDEALAAAARKHAALMADQEELSHRLPGEAALDARIAQAGARFSSVGENVAIGPEPPEIHTGWMHSPGHRANILGTHFNALGVGVAERDGQFYAVEDFSRAVENLSLEQQEKQVAAMLTARGFQLQQSVENLEAARKLCGGSDAARSLLPAHPDMEILRYEAPDLGSLPAQLDRSLRNSRYRQATVGACQDAVSENGAPRFRVVILLFSQV
jgi:uncharacterized protein YkwD